MANCVEVSREFLEEEGIEYYNTELNRVYYSAEDAAKDIDESLLVDQDLFDFVDWEGFFREYCEQVQPIDEADDYISVEESDPIVDDYHSSPLYDEDQDKYGDDVEDYDDEE